MKLSTKRTKLEQALDHSQNHAQAKHIMANLREKQLKKEFGQTTVFVAQAAKPLEKLEQLGPSICTIHFR